MNTDTTDNGAVTFEFTTQYDVSEPAAQNVQIANPKTCADPLCFRTTDFGSDYCSRHSRDVTIPTPQTDFETTTNSGPTNRDLQRQLDRLEGKLDAIVAALKENDNE